MTLWQITADQRLRYLLATLAMTTATLFAFSAPLLGKYAIDVVVAGSTEPAPRMMVEVTHWLYESLVSGETVGNDSGNVTGRITTFLWLCAALALLMTAIGGIFHYLRGRLAAIASESIVRRLRDQLYTHLEHLPANFHDEADTGDLVQRCSSDVETLRVFLSTDIVEIGRSIILVVTVIPLLLWLDVTMALVSVVLIPPITVFAYIFFQRVKNVFQDTDEAEAAMTAVLQENLTGIRVVRAFARAEFETQKFAERNRVFRDHNARLINLMGWYWGISDFFAIAQLGLVLILGSYWMTTGHLTVGSVFAFLTYISMVIWPVRQLGRVLTDAGKAVISLSRVNYILTTATEDQLAEDSLHPEQKSALVPDAAALGDIRFEGVFFSYSHAAGNDGDGDNDGDIHKGIDGDIQKRIRLDTHDRNDEDIHNGTKSDTHDGGETSHNSPQEIRQSIDISDINLSIEAGETVAFVGPPGCGKSTLIRLLLRLYTQQAGVISLDGTDIRSLDRHWLRNQFGIVLQEPFLYSRSIRDNLTIGRPHATETDIHEATSHAAIADSIAAFPAGMAEQVGERGVTLSGGQRQRLALARALLKDPPILVLDDALSAVDTGTERLILDALAQRRRRDKKQTTVIIAHRLSSIMAADRIYVMDRGRIVEVGSHAELTRRDGPYRKLCEIQGNLDSAIEEDIHQSAAHNASVS